MRKTSLAILFAAAATTSAATAECDRPCLQIMLDRYLNAMVKHNPAQALLDPKFRYTENAVAMKTDEGLWKSAMALGAVRRRYLDAVSGQAGYFGLIEEANGFGIATVRIRVADKKITEAEVIIGRKADGAFDADGLIGKPPPEDVHPARSREELVKAAQSYFEGLANSNGAGVLAHKGCYRIENGLLLTGRPIKDSQPPAVADCATLGNFKATINGVSHRRYPLVDEEAGVVLGMGILERPQGAKRPDGSIYPRNLLSEYFIVEDGRIRGIYAAMHYMTPDIADAPGWQ